MLKKYIHISKYARYLHKEKRRETWEETVSRYMDFFSGRHPVLHDDNHLVYNELFQAIENQDVMPSMRAMMTAGKALERDEVSGYNCAAIGINHIRCFDEIFFLLMNGCGVGFSVERQYVEQLPEVSEDFHGSDTVIQIRDSKIGWASALRELIGLLYGGRIPTWDATRVRPAGSRLKTFGGRASGPEPLEKLFRYTVGVFQNSKGRKLTSLECHDLCCKIADAVIVGSVRRSACISLSNLTDDRMRRAKMGEWWRTSPHRALANNGTAYSSKPDLDSFSKEMRAMHRSKSGERSIVNLMALKDKAGECGRTEDYKGWFILNPCGEAILRATGGLCNLTEVIIRPDDTLEDLKGKVKQAAILGTLQSTLTNFRYLRSCWQRNAEEERLLGVSLTGIMDHLVMSGFSKVSSQKWFGSYSLEDSLRQLKEVARETNKIWADKLGIPASKQLTLVKPSGTVSQLVDSSSGMHPRMFPYYVRNLRQDIKDPLSDLMKAEGVPWVHETDEDGNVHKVIFKFPVKAPEGAITQDSMTAIEQLELWKIYREHWCDGNPSQTIHYKEDEYFAICDWVWRNWDIIGGLAFFPKDDHIYENAPYQQVTKEEYEMSLETFPKEINWDRLPEFELEDSTTAAQEYACAGGACEV